MSPLEFVEYGLRVGDAERGGQGLETELGINVRILLRVGKVGPVELSVFRSLAPGCQGTGTCHALR